MNLSTFILAGYDTVATTLSYCLYTISQLPKEREKLLREIEEYYPNDSNVDFKF